MKNKKCRRKTECFKKITIKLEIAESYHKKKIVSIFRLQEKKNVCFKCVKTPNHDIMPTPTALIDFFKKDFEILRFFPDFEILRFFFKNFDIFTF